MAPNKSNYIIISNDKTHKNDDVLNIKLLDGVINKSESLLVLVICDKHLTFKNQLNYLKEACMKRINVLRVLSNKIGDSQQSH
jgi:hypothetical protein